MYLYQVFSKPAIWVFIYIIFLLVCMGKLIKLQMNSTFDEKFYNSTQILNCKKAFSLT